MAFSDWGLIRGSTGGIRSLTRLFLSTLLFKTPGRHEGPACLAAGAGRALVPGRSACPTVPEPETADVLSGLLSLLAQSAGILPDGAGIHTGSGQLAAVAHEPGFHARCVGLHMELQGQLSGT